MSAAGRLPEPGTEVSIVEVGPRDGLQNESAPVSLEEKVALVEGLANAGLRYIEAGSFVSPRWVPQMADSESVFSAVRRSPGVTYAALTPNLKGFERAVAVSADEVAVFTAASESFSQRNTNCSITESLDRIRPVVEAARSADLRVRAYVSCVLGCPYEGEIVPSAVAQVSEALLELGCYEVSLGDTIGVGTAGSLDRLLDELLPVIDAGRLALHCHDTYGQALANILRGLERDIRIFDSSVAGLGGCPYARGATGNVATENLVYLFEGLGLRSGVNLEALISAGERCCQAIGRENPSSVARALAG